MERNFGCGNWQDYIPVPVCEDKPEYFDFYKKAWELAYSHIKENKGMPQSPYMDEALCDTQVWIWDSCFMALFCKYVREVFPGVETLNNFYEVLYGGKHLPVIIPTEREPFWANSSPGMPYEIKIHIADNPPLFAWAEYENALMCGDVDYVKELLYDHEFLQKHYEWMENLCKSEHPEGVFIPTCLFSEKYGYKWEGGRSGMDNTPRGRLGANALEERPNNPDMLWIDAICQQALTAKMISRLFKIVNDKQSQEEWNKRYLKKKEIINSLYWDEADGFYYDIDCNTHAFYKVMTIASYWAMTAGVATEKQALRMAEHLSDSDTFGGFVPFVSVSRSDADYKSNGDYWRGSVWLPVAYAALKGLVNYGMYKDAHETACKLFEHMYKTYIEFEPHTIWECYSPEAFEPAIHHDKFVRPDFCGWSALGPVSVYIEFVLGFHSIDAFGKVVEWEKPDTFKGKIGISNLRFGNVITDVIASGNKCTVSSNEPYILRINGKEYHISVGINEFMI